MLHHIYHVYVTMVTWSQLLHVYTNTVTMVTMVITINYKTKCNNLAVTHVMVDEVWHLFLFVHPRVPFKCHENTCIYFTVCVLMLSIGLNILVHTTVLVTGEHLIIICFKTSLFIHGLPASLINMINTKYIYERYVFTINSILHV